MNRVVVIGAGQAGSSLVAGLRKEGFDGEITLVGAEQALPYQRPPLSKGYLLGEMDLDRLYLRPDRFYEEQNIALKLGRQVTGIDPVARTITFEEETLAYDQLALTTGSHPRRLPDTMGGGLAGVHVLRNLADVDGLMPYVSRGAKALIVGGGYIGLEAAAVCAKCGVEVTLLEAADRILQRVAAPQTSDYFRALHKNHGVDLREGVGLERLAGAEGKVTAAVLSDKSELCIDFVIVGIGVDPTTQLAEMANLEIDNGVRTDAFGRTSDAAIWAAGDCASFPFNGERIRLESVPNAIEHAETVAKNMLGADREYVAKPWFWSDQYDVKLQIAGLNNGYDQVVSRRGEGLTTSFWYYRKEHLIAVEAMNDPRAYMVGKRLIDGGKNADPVLVEDLNTDLKQLLKM
ncbi:NAD(P)/FAD-dependent oxidoreductase [Roseibium sp. SCP14]|uniref:NAD(P)/FAD-dependent oxidoreductase n=1 Tax=Roseibium sp. SCP14 TaxID=3141375 RepID=UPI0033382320